MVDCQRVADLIFPRWVLWLACFLPVGVAATESASSTYEEAMLVSALQDINASQLDHALARLQTLVRQQPDFKLAQLVYADLLLAKAQPLDRFGGDAGEPAGTLSDLTDEARRRYDRYQHHIDAGSVPDALLQMSPDQSHAIAVDIERSRLFVFENTASGPVLKEDFYAAAGKNGPAKEIEGDRKTPVGVYFVTGRISDEKLPELYGAGALPINYPNVWDRRRGKTGHGIWLHGVPRDTFTRAPRSSDGCVTMANKDFARLSAMVELKNTPVIIARRLHWVAREEAGRAAAPLLQQLGAWRSAWESLDVDDYAQFYSANFDSYGVTWQQWMQNKRRVNAAKTFIDVRLDDLSLLRDPVEPRLVVATFQQDYASDNYTGSARKRQYWFQEDDGKWRILHESTL